MIHAIGPIQGSAAARPLHCHISLRSLLINGKERKKERKGLTPAIPRNAFLSNFLADTKHFYGSVPPEY